MENLDEIQNYISILGNNHNILIKDIKFDNIIHNAYINIKEWVDKLYNTNNYFLITETIDNQYRPSQLKPGSIGAFLWGCSGNYYGDVSKSCSNLCLNGIPFNQMEVCQYQIWKYNNNILIKENNVQNDIAYIYVNDDWKGIDEQNYILLKTNNVKYILIVTTNNSRHYVKNKIQELDQMNIIYNQIELKKAEINYIYILYIILILFIIYLIKNVKI